MLNLRLLVSNTQAQERESVILSALQCQKKRYSEKDRDAVLDILEKFYLQECIPGEYLRIFSEMGGIGNLESSRAQISAR